MKPPFDKDAFWSGLTAAPHWPLAELGWPERPVHSAGNEAANHWDFDGRAGLGFRGTIAIAPTRDHIRVELSTATRSGRALVQALIDGTHPDTSLDALCARSGLKIALHTGKADGKFEVVWDNANLGSGALRPVHYLWAATTLEALATHLVPIIAGSDEGDSDGGDKADG